MTVTEFVISPILWYRAGRAHSRICARINAYIISTPPSAESFRHLTDERKRLIDAYNLTWKYFGPTVLVLSCITGGLVAVCMIGDWVK